MGIELVAPNRRNRLIDADDDMRPPKPPRIEPVAISTGWRHRLPVCSL
jgi:hypothetical protein